MKILILIQIVVLLAVGYSQAERSPYSYIPSRMYRPEAEIFKKAEQLIAVAPLRPLVIKDKDGNTMYTTSRGEVMVRVDTSGNKTFYIKSRRTHQKNVDGEIERRWDRQRGSNKVIVRNEFGEKVGVEEYGLGGKIVAEYDEKDNLVRSYEYNEYGKRIEWVVDELALTRTKYDRYGKALYNVNFEGYEVAWYEYDDEGRLKYKKDIYENKTFFDSLGNMTYTEDEDGNVITTYKYKTDEKGYSILESVKDEITGNVTIYKDGRPNEVRNHTGAVIVDYKWQGTKLIYTENIETGEITWYKNGKRAYTSYFGYLVNEWMYHNGKLVGMWDETNNSLLLYTHGREEIAVTFDKKPELEEILEEYKLRGLEI